MGIATAVETAIDNLLTTFVSSKSAALSAALLPVALSGTTIYLIVMGYAVMRGDAHDALHTILWKWFKMSLIAGVALSAGEYQASIVEGINGIQGAFIQAFGNATTIGGLVDNMAQPYDALGQQLWSEATTGFWPNFSLLVAAAMVAIAQAFLFIIGLGMYLLAKVALALVLAVGPAFILCAMFPATQRFTESWLGQALNFVLLNVLIGLSISMLTSFASQFAAHIQTNVGNTAIMKDTMALLLVSCALGVVMLNLNTIASALSGGASIAGIGRDVARALMKGKKDDEDKNKGPQPGGGSIDQGGGGSRSGKDGGTPLYQRNVIDNIRRAA